MESQDGISVRSMRLKVLYTFDDASKTNCLARWPHLLDIQTAALDEKTQIGVIELKTCIQAIVSASPELIAKLGQDYTVYAYDYSEYETPLVGQGMLSWVLASAPDAPGHQSKTMITGRVCKNVMGLFSKGAQETLEVKLRLVPVPMVLQSEYLDSMQKYRELSSVIPHDFDAQSWMNFLRQNPGLLGPSNPQQPVQIASPLDHTGIERFHQLLSEGSTPREISSMPPNGHFRSVSPSQSALAPPSRVSTPGQLPSHQQQQLELQQSLQIHHQRDRAQSDVIRPSSSASMRESDLPSQTLYASRRGSVQSGYGSGEESMDLQPRKRAKLYRAEWPGKSDLNIERQPSSLRVAASTAASVRIHRPTPINPAIAAAQSSNEEPVRPPTPISGLNDLPRRARPPRSLLRESSVQSNNSNNQQYTSPYPMSDDHPQSPEGSHYQGLFEPSFSMPSSPPVLDCGFPSQSSPVLPPMTTDPDSGFMSGGLDDLLDEDIGTPLDDCTRPISNEGPGNNRNARPAVQASSPVTAPAVPKRQNESTLIEDGLPEQPMKEAAPVPTLPRAPASTAGSRPSSRASFRQAPKPLAPAPMSQSELEQLINAIPASDPVMPSQAHPHYSHSWTGPMSDFPIAETPTPKPMTEDCKVRSGAGARRLRQVQARLDKCIRDGQVPPYCENCGVIETPTWRRAWSKEIVGSEEDANQLMKDPTMFFWQTLERNDKEEITKFKVFKKSLADEDKDYVQILLCNPCGLWLHKFRSMRPENKWNKSANNKRKRPPRNRKGGGPLSDNGSSTTRSRSKTQSAKPAGSSPASDGSSPAVDDATPRADNDNEHDNDHDNNDDDVQELPSKKHHANSMELRRSPKTAQNSWQDAAADALLQAIQSSPTRNVENHAAPVVGEKSPPPKSVRRALFPNSENEGTPLKTLGDSVLNSPRRSPRISSRDSGKQSHDKENTAVNSDLDGLFESPSFDFDLPASPTPRRRNLRNTLLGEKRGSPSSKARKDAGLDLTPTKLTAQKLQRLQASPGSASRQNKTLKTSRSQVPDLAALPDDVFGAEAFEGIDSMIIDIFEDATSAVHSDSFFSFEPSKSRSSSNWPDWIPSDYVSPTGSDEDQTMGEQADAPNGDSDSEDLINAILSDPDIQKNSHFDPFHFANSSTLDSGFFGSDSLNADLISLGVKAKTSSSKPASTEEQAQQTTV